MSKPELLRRREALWVRNNLTRRDITESRPTAAARRTSRVKVHVDGAAHTGQIFFPDAVSAARVPHEVLRRERRPHHPPSPPAPRRRLSRHAGARRLMIYSRTPQGALRKLQASGPKMDREMETNGRPHRVLVVDDEPNIVDVVSMALRFQGFAVESAGTGATRSPRSRRSSRT
jgi:hypothetical protein